MEFYFVMMHITSLLDDFGDVGTFKSSCKVWLVRYHGAFVIIVSILDWLRCIIATLDLLAQPHSSIPHVSREGLSVTRF
jgi:hypothetical protein